MLLEEMFLQIITEKVITSVWDKVDGRVRRKLGRDPIQQAFRYALGKTFEQFEEHYPQWTADLFDTSFFVHEGAPILAY